MKTFTDPITGKKFCLGARGSDPLLERVKEYISGREGEGVSEVALVPNKLDIGDTYRCGSCGQDFVYSGEDQEAFIESIKQHGRAHGVCQIMPVL